MHDYPLVSIIVVGYNSRPFLSVCLDALLIQSYPGDVEILVVDNASTDGSADFVQEHYPRCSVIETGANLGYAGGVNRGAQRAAGAILAILNPDTRAEPDWLFELVKPLLKDRSIGLTTSKVVLMDCPERINAAGNDLSLSGITTCRHAGRLTTEVIIDEEVSAISGAAFAVRTELFNALGGFDERFWMYLEDTDLSWRARLTGYRIVLATRSIVAHHYTLQVSAEKMQRIECNRYMMLAKNYSLSALAVLLPQLLIIEALTWGWAAQQGPRYMRAKCSVLAWVLRNTLELYRAHRSTQAQRQVPDRVLLQMHRPAPLLTNLNTGVVSRLTASLLVPTITLLGAVGLLTLGLVRLPRIPTRPRNPR